MRRCDPGRLLALVSSIFERAGADRRSAHIVASHLLDANASGHDSHGVIRVPDYLRDIASGALDPAATPETRQIAPNVARIDGHWGFGQIAGRAGAEVASEMARVHGLSAVAIVRCHHLGRMGDYVERGAQAGCVLLATAGGHPPVAVAHGGRERVLGANPIAAGFPCGDEAFILDMATTSVAVGKVMVAAARGEPLAAGLVVDADGISTTDPAALAAGGALTPFGGHKGYALALLSELLCTAMVGSPTDESPRGGVFAKQAALFIALRVDLFRDLDDVRGSAATRLGAVRSSAAANEHVPVRIPGDPEREARCRQLAEIPLEEATLAGLLEAARSSGLTVEPGVVLDDDRPLGVPTELEV